MKMRNFKVILLILLVLNTILSCNNVNSQAKKDKVDNTVVESATPQPRLAILSKFKESKVKIYGEWNVEEDSPLIYLVENTENGDIFSVLNSFGKVLYEKKVTEIEKVYDIFALRTENSQLVFEYNEGGSDSFVEILDYNEGKLDKIISDSNGENSFGADISIQPQFRPNINPAKEPFEILLTEYGLASSAGKFTKILRYKNKKYRYFGKFDREKIDEFKEKIISR
jgi:hypothetical protein